MFAISSTQGYYRQYMVTTELHLDTLRAGEEVRVVAGVESEAYKYIFSVVKPGLMPHCMVLQTDPLGEIVGPMEAILQGSGNWTTERQNPMMRPDWFAGRPYRERAMSIGYGVLRVGSYVVMSDPNVRTGERLCLEPVITRILFGTQDFDEKTVS